MNKLAVQILITFLGLSSFALAADRYIWDEQGLQRAANCQFTSQARIPYLVAPKADRQWDLVSASSKAQGAKELRGFVLQIKNSTALTVGGHSLQGTFLQSAFDGNDYVIYLCQKGTEKKAYIAFNLFVAGHENSIAQVGVATAGFDFLKMASIQTAEDATKKLVTAAAVVAAPAVPAVGPSPVKSISPMGNSVDKALASSKPLNAVSPANQARITFYDPEMNTLMEGGPKNRFTEMINSVEDSIKNGRPVTLAADIYGSFGSLCNQREKRCLVLISLAGFDALYPAYRKKFSQLPKDHFLGIVEDTGKAFFNSGGKHFDVAVRSRQLARAVPNFVGKTGAWSRMAGPCGTGTSSRLCDLAQAQTISLK